MKNAASREVFVRVITKYINPYYTIFGCLHTEGDTTATSTSSLALAIHQKDSIATNTLEIFSITFANKFL